MNCKINLFRKILIIVFVSTWICASTAWSGGGGISGGSGAARNFEEVNICNFGEAGDSCMLIKLECSQTTSAGDTRPCSQRNLFRNPQFLQYLNSVIQSDPIPDHSQSGG